MPVVMLPRAQPRTAMPRTALAAFTADSARDFACDVLRAAGVVSVVPAGGGRDALRTARDQHIDVIVTDWPGDDIELGDFVSTLHQRSHCELSPKCADGRSVVRASICGRPGS